MAESVSLSPNFISYSSQVNQQPYAFEKISERTLTETVSFSLTIGTTPIVKSSLKVLTAFKYRVRCHDGMSAVVVSYYH